MEERKKREQCLEGKLFMGETQGGIKMLQGAGSEGAPHSLLSQSS